MLAIEISLLLFGNDSTKWTEMLFSLQQTSRCVRLKSVLVNSSDSYQSLEHKKKLRLLLRKRLGKNRNTGHQ